MRTYNDNMAAVIADSSKSSRWAIEIALDDAGTDLIYFTSHSDVPVPGGNTVIHETLQNSNSRLQRLRPDQFNSSIGDLSFSLLNLNGQVEAEFRGKRSAGKHLYGKRARLIRGAEGLDWADYITETTQWIDKKFDYRKGRYEIVAKDSQSFMDRVICQPKETRLAGNIDENSLTIPVYTTEGFQRVQRGADFIEAPNELCTFIEISDNNQKEFIKVTGINSTDFTVERGAFGTTPQVWTLPANASQDRGPKIRELIAVDMNLVEFAWAILTGEDLNNPGTALFPEHWHCKIPAAQLVRSEFLALRPLVTTKAQNTALKKANGKQFFEEQVALLLGHYLRVNGDGVMNLKALHGIHENSNIVGTITADQVVDHGRFKHDSSSIVNNLEAIWSWDERSSKPQYRRKTPLVVENSTDEFGEHKKTVYLQLLNGSSSTSSTLVAVANRFMDRYAGDAAYFSVNVLHKLAAYEIGDVIRVEHAEVADYTSTGSLGRAMQIIGKTVDQKRGISLDLFGSTYFADPVTDGDLRVLSDSFYPSEGTPVPNVTASSLTADTTLVGTADMNAPASIFYVDSDFTIPAGRTLTVIGNVQLRVGGYFNYLGDVIGAGGGDVNIVSGWLGDSVGIKGISDEYLQGESLPITFPIQPEYLFGQHDAFPALDLVNNAGTSITGIPTDLRGTAGAQGGNHELKVWLGGEPFTDTLAGGARVPGGAGLTIICQGMGGNGTIDMSGARNNPSPTKTSSTETGSRPMQSGASGDGAPGGLLILIDGGGISAVPQLGGYLVALGDGDNDFGLAAARIQMIPQSLTAIEDDPISDPGNEGVLIQFSVNGGFDDPPAYANFNGLTLADIPDADEPTKGLSQKASDFEVSQGLEDSKFITSKQLTDHLNGGSGFDPASNQTITGDWDFTKKIDIDVDAAIKAHFKGSYSGLQGIRVERDAGDRVDLLANYSGFGGGLDSSSKLLFGVNGDGLTNPALTINTDKSAELVGKLHLNVADWDILQVERNNSDRNANITFKTTVNTKYFGLDADGDLSFGSSADISSAGNKLWTAENLNPNAPLGTSVQEFWRRSYSASNTNILALTMSDNVSALEAGGVYRVKAHIDGTGTDQSSSAVFWNSNGTWRVNVTGQSGTSSNHIQFLVSGGVPSIKTYHANNYNIQVHHERLNLYEELGTDNSGHLMGVDSFMSNIAGVLTFNPWGNTSTHSGQEVHHSTHFTVDGYAPADAGAIDTSGFYFAASATVDKPANGMLLHGNYTRSDNSFDSQLLVSHATDSMYFRAKDSGVWENWKEVYHTGKNIDLQNKDVVGIDQLIFDDGPYLQGVSGTTVALDGSSSTAYLRFQTDGTIRGYVGANSSNEIIFLDDTASNVMRLYPAGGYFRHYGTSTGNANVSYLRFDQADGTRDGYVGVGSAANRNVTLLSDAGNVNLSAGAATKFRATPTVNESLQNLDLNSNELLNVSIMNLDSGGQVNSDYNGTYIIKDHNNGNVTLSAAGGNLYLGYQNTGSVVLSRSLINSASNYTILTNAGDRLNLRKSPTDTTQGIILDADLNSIIIDSSSGGSNTVLGEQAAALSIGESGQGSASVHLTYTGDGYGHLGMGTITGGIPGNRVLRMYYQSQNALFYGVVTSNVRIEAPVIRHTSDIKVKANLEVIDRPLERIEYITGYTFDRLDVGGRHAGTVAQDNQNALAESVSTDDKGLLNVDDSATIGLLVECIKALKAKVARLENG